jgi:hypothetical protein
LRFGKQVITAVVGGALVIRGELAPWVQHIAAGPASHDFAPTGRDAARADQAAEAEVAHAIW